MSVSLFVLQSQERKRSFGCVSGFPGPGPVAGSLLPPVPPQGPVCECIMGRSLCGLWPALSWGHGKLMDVTLQPEKGVTLGSGRMRMSLKDPILGSRYIQGVLWRPQSWDDAEPYIVLTRKITLHRHTAVTNNNCDHSTL